MIYDHALMIHYDRYMYLSWWIPDSLHFKVKHSKTLTCCPHCVLSFHTVLAINSHYFLKQYEPVAFYNWEEWRAQTKFL
jgi:hypothetical protein